MNTLSGPIRRKCAANEIPPPIKPATPKPQPVTPGFLQRFAAHITAPACVNYTAGALVFAGAALFFTGFGSLPGIILMSVGTTLFIATAALATNNLPADIGTWNYLEFSGQCFVWGLCFVFTLPTIVLLKITIYFAVRVILQDANSNETGELFSTDLSWLMAPPTLDILPDSQAFSGLEVA